MPYKRYLIDPSIPIPRSTRHNRKRKMEDQRAVHVDFEMLPVQQDAIDQVNN